MSRHVFAELPPSRGALRRTRKFRATVLIGVFSMAAPIVAQSSLPVSVDQRVRVETAGSTVTGRVLAVAPGSLRLAVDGHDQVTIATATVRRVGISRGSGRNSAAKKSAIKWAVIAGAIGAISLGLQHETVGESGSSVPKAAARGADRWEQVWP